MLGIFRKIALRWGLWRLQWVHACVTAGFLPAGLSRYGLREVWEGDAEKGAALLAGEFTFHGDTFSLTHDSWRRVEQMDVAWQREMHGFAWLRDAGEAPDNGINPVKLRQFLQGWWRRQLHHSPVGRHPDIVGERVAHWLIHADFLLRGCSPPFRRRFHKQLYGSLIKLERTRQRRRGKTSFTALKGLIFGALVMPSAHFLLAPALDTLKQVLTVRFNPDGGHVSRSPEWHLHEMRTLMEIRAVLDERKTHNLQFLDDALFQMMAALATFTHPDGSLALFHDTTQTSAAEVRRLWQSWRKPEPQPRRLLPETKFARLQQAASAVIMDVGVPNPGLSRSFFSTLSFEFSSEEERIIANCGGYRGNNTEWRRACKSTAAHSTLCIDNANSWQSPEEAHYTLVFQHEVSCQMEEKDDALFLDAAYNGYVPYAGLVHYRKLMLHNEGRNLKGLDVLMPHKSLTLRETHRVQIRFHLAPGITIGRTSRGNIELHTPGGQHWRFLSPKEFAAGVEESIYLGHDGKPQPTLQLCIESLLTGQKDLRVDWEFKRI